MGMYDHVLIEDDIPKLDINHDRTGWQSKSIRNAPMLEYYKIEDRRLYKEDVEYSKVPEEERPYGDDDGFLKMAGSVERDRHGWDDVEYHGYIEIHTIADDEYISYNLKFTDGELQDIEEGEGI